VHSVIGSRFPGGRELAADRRQRPRTPCARLSRRRCPPRQARRRPRGRRAGAGRASLSFGYLAGGEDLGRYAGSSYSYLGFDELTRFEEAHYRRMFRVLRQPSGTLAGAAASDGTRLSEVPVRDA
jgi:hypothetical protein